MRLVGRLQVASDKSLTHRAIIFSSLSEGTTRIINPLLGEDCLSTINIFKALGVHFTFEDNDLIVISRGRHAFKKPTKHLKANNSGTTARLLMGALAAASFEFVIEGDESLSRRPMKRVSSPLQQMGANILLSEQNTLPAKVSGQSLQGITYELPVASAQIKSALMLAAFQASDETVLTGKVYSRDHTEKMFKAFNLTCEVSANSIKIPGHQTPKTPKEISICGDISSAAFFMVGAALLEGSEVYLENVGINPTRSGIIDVMKQMNANIEILNERYVNYEEVGDIVVKYSPNLCATILNGELLPRLIDEVPILALLCAFAKGQTIIKDAKELKVKETNRIDVTVKLLQSMGVDICATDDGMIINGSLSLKLNHAVVDSHGDHRMAMMLYIANLVSNNCLEIQDLQAMNVSYPHFVTDIQTLIKE